MLLTHASINQALGTVSFPPRGNFMVLTLSNGDKQRIHYQCIGPTTSSNPTFLLDASAAHGIADFWPLQREMSNRGERVCMLDKPGFGYSDNFLAWQNANPLTMYNEFVTKLVTDGEGSSFVMVGWGGGGDLLYEYSLAHPERAAGFAFLDTVAEGIEWREVAARDSLTQAQLDDVKIRDLSGRSIIFGLLRGVIAPLGLLSVVVPGHRESYAWPERFEEFHWYSLTPKTWTTQWFTILPWFDTRTLIGDLGVFGRSSAALMGRPVVMIATNRSRADVCKGRTHEDCPKLVFAQSFLLAEKQTIANVTGNATVVYCTASDCSLDAVRRLPAFVAGAILNQSWTRVG